MVWCANEWIVLVADEKPGASRTNDHQKHVAVLVVLLMNGASNSL